MDKNTPLGVVAIYDQNTNTTYVHFSYAEDSDAEYFIVEVWDEAARRWIPYDRRYGIVSRDQK